MFVQPKQSEWEKTLMKQKKNSTSVQVADGSCQNPERVSGKTNLPIVGHSAEELQLQVELTGQAVEEEPQAAGQVLSRHKQKSVQKTKNTCRQKWRAVSVCKKWVTEVKKQNIC